MNAVCLVSSIQWILEIAAWVSEWSTTMEVTG